MFRTGSSQSFTESYRVSTKEYTSYKQIKVVHQRYGDSRGYILWLAAVAQGQFWQTRGHTDSASNCWRLAFPAPDCQHPDGTGLHQILREELEKMIMIRPIALALIFTSLLCSSIAQQTIVKPTGRDNEGSAL